MRFEVGIAVKSAENMGLDPCMVRCCMLRTGWAASAPTYNGRFLLWTEMIIWIGREVVCIREVVAMAGYLFIIGGTAAAV
jgi:hypothetical protein